MKQITVFCKYKEDGCNALSLKYILAPVNLRFPFFFPPAKSLTMIIVTGGVEGISIKCYSRKNEGPPTMENFR